MPSPVSGDAALVVLPPDAISDPLDRWRRRYDPTNTLSLPHITVVYPPFAPKAIWPDVAAVLTERLQTIEPFAIRLATFGSFAGASMVLWLRPEDGGHLARLRTIISELLPAYVAKLSYEYVPHLTLGFFDTAAELKAAQDAIALELMELNPIEFTVDELCYVVCSDEGCWDVADRIPLGGPRET